MASSPPPPLAPSSPFASPPPPATTMTTASASSETPLSSSSSSLDASSRILVLQPGSLNLRLGRASDPQPVELPHCLARRRKVPRPPPSSGHAPSTLHRDPWLIPQAKLDPASFQTVEDCRFQICHSLSSSLQSTGAQRFSTPEKHLAQLNGNARPQPLSQVDVKEAKGATTEWLDTTQTADVLVGEDVLRLNPASDEYNVHFPFRRGDINLHSGIGGSQTSILVDLEAIWSQAIEKYLHIPLSDLPNYRCVLLIPALYKRPLIKHYLTVLLVNMGFKGCFVLQDHVAATFGAGLGYACVVDIGDQKTSISCVEDGISHPDTRIHLDYGGSDITQLFYFLSRKVGFPYKSCQSTESRLDADLLHKIKEENCHLDLDLCGVQERKFDVIQPGSSPPTRYTFFVGDDTFVAPAALFHTDLLELTGSETGSGRKRVRMMGKDPGDSEDPHDHIYLSETSRKYTKAGGTADAGDLLALDSQPLDDDLEIVADVSVSAGQSNDNSMSADNSSMQASTASTSASERLLSLDQAIAKSIEACSTDDLKRKMYGCVLLVGAGARFRGMQKYLAGKLALQIPFPFRSDLHEVLIDPKDTSSANTTWKGAAILSCLETAQELWIAPDEWKQFGQKVLRERAPFPWA